MEELNTPKTLEEILALPDDGRKIEYLRKGRKTPMPKTKENLADWDPNLHEIVTDKAKYPKIKITTELEKDIYDEDGNFVRKEAAKTKEVEPNRVALPLEQSIVNIHVAFAVGNEPKMDCTPSDDKEKGVLVAVKSIMKKVKMKYLNRKIVRALFAEQEVALYWYAVQDDSFWAKLKAKIAGIFGNVSPKYKLKAAVWSPFRGDKLYPFYDESGDLVAVSREYEKQDLDGQKHQCFMTVAPQQVIVWEQGAEGWKINQTASFKHGFRKLPIIYGYLPEVICKKIRHIRIRLEKLISEYADCIDYHFFPILMLFGDLEKLGGDARNRIAQLMGDGADAKYLTWNQSAEPIKVEWEKLYDQAYDLTDTPQISFQKLQGLGSAFSGVSFRFAFMGAHMATANHGEVLGEFFQRNTNFLVSAVGDLNSTLLAASDTIDIDTDLDPYMIDNDKEKVETAVAAKAGGVWSTKHGVAYCSNFGEIADEIEEIKEEEAAKKPNEGSNE